MLAAAESDDPTATRTAAAEELRRTVATVGRRGEPGEKIRCIVSVSMLTEGWDANNVTHIFGLRPFQSQLLIEQVVGRGLRRMVYDVDRETGRLAEEYVDVYGIPFSLIPFKGRDGTDVPPQPPAVRVRALQERSAFAIRFPNVEGYVLGMKRFRIRCDVDAMARLDLDPNEPTGTLIQPQVAYSPRTATAVGTVALNDRIGLYEAIHPQRVVFDIARTVVNELTATTTGKQQLAGRPRAELFPQVLRITDRYLSTKVRLQGLPMQEVALAKYRNLIVERLLAAIEPDAEQGEPPLLPRLNPQVPTSSTAGVDFKTTKPLHPTIRSHIDQVTLDSLEWERSAAFFLETCDEQVAFYAKNEQLGLNIPYDYQGTAHDYLPDFLVRMTDGSTLLLEIKGQRTDVVNAKDQSAMRWVSAVNQWGELGIWDFFVCEDPRKLKAQLAWIAGEHRSGRLAMRRPLPMAPS